MWSKIRELIFSRENWLAFWLCMIIILLIIFTASLAPVWIYQSF
jgi:hypothetical protein